MLHVSHLRHWDIAASPFGQELRRLNIPHRFLVTPVNLRYRSPLELLLRIYPTLLWRSSVSAVRSLLLSHPRPAAIIVSSDIEAVIFGALRTIARRRTEIIFQTLIVTPRRSAARNALYLAYWRVVLANIDLAICHARAEIATYARLFPRHAGKFVFVPYGTTVSERETLLATPPPPAAIPLIVTAGRSGRDYPTLARAIAGLPCRLKIICDIAAPVADIPASDQIEIMRDCFDELYMRTLAEADIVVVPLDIDDVSAGQLVLLHAAALARPVIITRTATTIDYATDEVDALLVDICDAAALRHAIQRLLGDPALRARLATAAAARFDREHSTEAYVRGLVTVVEKQTSKQFFFEKKNQKTFSN